MRKSIRAIPPDAIKTKDAIGLKKSCFVYIMIAALNLHLQDILTDVAKVGTMLVVSQLLTGNSLTDPSWQWFFISTLLGFTAYHLTTRNINTKGRSLSKGMLDDWAKFGTMLIVVRLLAGGSLFDTQWIYSVVAVLIGFMVYHIFIGKHVQGKELTYSRALRDVIDDWAKFGTMLFVSQFISCESILDPKWIVNALATVVGYSVYDVTLAHLL